MALLQKDIDAAAPSSRPLSKAASSAGAESAEDQDDAQDEALWETKFADSQDTLARLAAQSQAHRSAGRTKKIGP